VAGDLFYELREKDLPCLWAWVYCLEECRKESCLLYTGMFVKSPK